MLLTSKTPPGILALAAFECQILFYPFFEKNQGGTFKI